MPFFADGAASPSTNGLKASDLYTMKSYIIVLNDNTQTVVSGTDKADALAFFYRITKAACLLLGVPFTCKVRAIVPVPHGAN